ncbi:hypothetical protein WJ438_15440 [Streptomyces sp. GD-15H]|uniref:hypothetical protein n=1 Tax=Streptomyces sp. GD-15H TaxID=3129112 RepID=UPI0032474127
MFFANPVSAVMREYGFDGAGPSQAGHGLPASTRGAGSGHVSPTMVNNAPDCLTRDTDCGTFKPSRT